MNVIKTIEYLLSFSIRMPWMTVCSEKKVWISSTYSAQGETNKKEAERNALTQNKLDRFWWNWNWKKKKPRMNACTHIKQKKTNDENKRMRRDKQGRIPHVLTTVQKEMLQLFRFFLMQTSETAIFLLSSVFSWFFFLSRRNE